MKTKKRKYLRDPFLLLGVLILSTLVGGFFNRLGFHETNIVVVYIFSVLLIARFTKGYVYGIAASALRQAVSKFPECI